MCRSPNFLTFLSAFTSTCYLFLYFCTHGMHVFHHWPCCKQQEIKLICWETVFIHDNFKFIQCWDIHQFSCKKINTSYLCVVMLHFECPVCQPNLYRSAVFSAAFCSCNKNSVNPNISGKICSASRIKKNPAEGSGRDIFSKTVPNPGTSWGKWTATNSSAAWLSDMSRLECCVCVCLVHDKSSELGRPELGRWLSAPDAGLHALVARHLSHRRTILHQHSRRSAISRSVERPISCRTCTADHQLADTLHVCIQTWLWRPANGSVSAC